MKTIDISSNSAMAHTLPPTEKLVTFYDQDGNPFKGFLEYNRWFRPIFYISITGNFYRANFVPIGWDELEATETADADAGSYADMPAMKEAA